MTLAAVRGDTGNAEMSSRTTHIVIQETSARDTRYVCAFPSEDSAIAFRKDCGRAGFRTSAVIAIPDQLRAVVSNDDCLLDDLTLLLSEAIQAQVEVIA